MCDELRRITLNNVKVLARFVGIIHELIDERAESIIAKDFCIKAVRAMHGQVVTCHVCYYFSSFSNTIKFHKIPFWKYEQKSVDHQ